MQGHALAWATAKSGARCHSALKGHRHRRPNRVDVSGIGGERGGGVLPTDCFCDVGVVAVDLVEAMLQQSPVDGQEQLASSFYHDRCYLAAVRDAREGILEGHAPARHICVCLGDLAWASSASAMAPPCGAQRQATLLLGSRGRRSCRSFRMLAASPLSAVSAHSRSGAVPISEPTPQVPEGSRRELTES